MRSVGGTVRPRALASCRGPKPPASNPPISGVMGPGSGGNNDSWFRQLAEKLPDIFTALFEAGTKEKDTAALSLLVNRAVPVRKGVPVNFKTRPLSNPSECAEAFGDILAAIGRGELTPDEVEIDPGFPQGSRQDARSPTPGSRCSALLMRFARRRGRGRQQRRERFEQLRRLRLPVHLSACEVRPQSS